MRSKCAKCGKFARSDDLVGGICQHCLNYGNIGRKIPCWAKAKRLDQSMTWVEKMEPLNDRIIVDPCDEYLLELKWRNKDRGDIIYPFKCMGGQKYYLHRIIAGARNGEIVDHINGNTLDNRRSNLRIVTMQENAMNVGLRKDSKTGIKGVNWRKDAHCWTAHIQYKKKKMHIGCYDNKEDAIAARLQKEEELYGEYMRKIPIKEIKNGDWRTGKGIKQSSKRSIGGRKKI